MGQKIFYIITPIQINLPIEVVHFKEKDVYIIPLLIDEFDFKRLIEFSDDSKNIDEFFKNYIIHNKYEYPTEKVFDYFSHNKIITFAIIGYREFLDISQLSNSTILFINSEKISLNEENIEELCHKKLNTTFTFNELINNNEKYWSYYTAEKYYFNQLEKHLQK